VHRGLPSPYLTLILTMDEPLTFAPNLDSHTPLSDHDTLLGGLHDRPALITHQGSQSGIQISLEPLAARALLGLPASELWCVDLDPADVLGGWVDGVRERLMEAPDWPARFAVVEDLLLQAEELRAGHTPGVPDEVRHIWHRLRSSGGTSRIGDLAAETGWSERHLTAKFTAETGTGPKQAGRIIRFHRATRSLAASGGGERDGMADVAAGAGYYDQSHMVRDFHEFAGCPPTRWVAEEFGNVQAGAYATASPSWA
jgi:AraC-like DNA-binding protein